ncbi:envelope stress response membrane protein PspC [Edwardsiella ictaluri]|uniref:envelope stress response membrane protein PspC n=1 Tax=Edwardsiella ictaluri TaxID=67780 RepID=UPI0018DDF393|nr:envelope stress response membrane protein PspC [Edwardsiella ictaluri]QPW26801.1 envelope stress response membrane protein PspC [Edwardsiella ictaluri]
MCPSLSPRRLYRLPQRGVFKGVCAGIADYFDVPVALVRAMAVVSIFCGLFVITLAAYLILAFTLPVAQGERPPEAPGVRAQLARTAGELEACEQRLRRLERYVTSPAFSLNRRFRQL